MRRLLLLIAFNFSSKGLHECVRLYRSIALLCLRDFARSVFDGEGAYYKHGHTPCKPRDVAFGR